MKRNRIMFWMGLIIVVLLIQGRGYYVRNLKVDDEFLDVTVEKVMILEEKRENNLPHTKKDDENFWIDLNSGHMADKSNLEIEISSRVYGMSKRLNEYYDAKLRKNNQEADEALALYFKYLSELETIFKDFRGKRIQVDILWENGIYK